MITHDLDKWNISLEDYEKGGWGSAVGRFKAPASIIKKFRKDVWINNTTGEVITTDPNDTVNWTAQNVFDVDTAFNELATTYMLGVVSMFQILRNVEFGWLDEDTRDSLRRAIYNAIEYAVLNRQVWENINGSSISTPNFTITADQTAWLVNSDMYGMKAWNLITNSGLQDYYFEEANRFFQSTPNGNAKVIGYGKETELAGEFEFIPNVDSITANTIDNLLNKYNL